MKLVLIVPYIVVACDVASDVQAQSSFAFQTLFPSAGIDAPVYDAQGVRVAGSNYLGELWGGLSSNSLSPLVNLIGNRRQIEPFREDFPGYIITYHSMLSVLDVSPWGWAWLQMRAWDARVGSTYEEVSARGLGGYGESALFYAQGGNPVSPTPTPPAPLYGLQSFSLREVIPEPSTWALLAAGGIALWWAPRPRRPR